MDDDDVHGFEDVLTCLASCDSRIRDEIELRCKASQSNDKHVPTDNEIGDVIPECIVIESYNGTDLEQIYNCFANVRKKLYSVKDMKRIQALCIEKCIDTFIDYNNLRISNPELPEDPRIKNQSWYDFLHPLDVHKLSLADFVRDVLKANPKIRIGNAYESWRLQNSAALPSLEYITNGYFGNDYTNFNTILAKYGAESTSFGTGRR